LEHQGRPRSAQECIGVPTSDHERSGLTRSAQECLGLPSMAPKPQANRRTPWGTNTGRGLSNGSCSANLGHKATSKSQHTVGEQHGNIAARTSSVRNLDALSVRGAAATPACVPQRRRFESSQPHRVSARSLSGHSLLLTLPLAMAERWLQTEPGILSISSGATTPCIAAAQSYGAGSAGHTRRSGCMTFAGRVLALQRLSSGRVS